MVIEDQRHESSEGSLEQQPRGRKDTSFAALNNAQQTYKSSTMRGARDSSTPEFGIDIEEFLNQRSELFGYYKNKEYHVEPFQINSIEEAIEDYELKERDF